MSVPVPWRVKSPTGRVHETALKDGAVRGVTVCGAAYIDLFATREYGTMWPSTDEPLTCKNCIAWGLLGA